MQIDTEITIFSVGGFFLIVNDFIYYSHDIHRTLCMNSDNQCSLYYFTMTWSLVTNISGQRWESSKMFPAQILAACSATIKYSCSSLFQLEMLHFLSSEKVLSYNGELAPIDVSPLIKLIVRVGLHPGLSKRSLIFAHVIAIWNRSDWRFFPFFFFFHVAHVMLHPPIQLNRIILGATTQTQRLRTRWMWWSERVNLVVCSFARSVGSVEGVIHESRCG